MRHYSNAAYVGRPSAAGLSDSHTDLCKHMFLNTEGLQGRMGECVAELPRKWEKDNEHEHIIAMR